MALKKDKGSRVGVTGDYHKIMHVDSTPYINIVVIGLFLTIEAKDAGNDPIETFSISFPTEDMAGCKNPIEYAYKLVKKLPEYLGALDV